MASTFVSPNNSSAPELNCQSTESACGRGGSVPEEETVSVIVPSFNHARFIARCLRSIIRQSHKPLELIVIDDGSEDDSVRRIEQELKDCSFNCELMVRNHKGLVQTLKEGLKQSRGKYFAYLGSDDLWLPEFLGSRVNLLQSRINAVLAYGHCFVIDEEDHILECTKDWASYGDGCVREMLLNVTVPFSPSVLYRRDILERHQWNEAAKLEDYELYIRLSNEGEFAFDDNILCAWRSHGQNNSRDLEFMLRECLEAQRRAAPELKLTPKELEIANARLKWRYAGDFVKARERAVGLKLLAFNLKGAPSYNSIVRIMANLILPTPVVRWRRQYIQRRTKHVYGSLKLNE